MACDSPRIPIDLQTFLVKSAGRKFDWVSCNCGFWVCEWIKLSRGFDPVNGLRGKFKTASSFKRHVTQAGGNEQFSRAIAAKAGLTAIGTPRLGDVGLVATGEGATMAIKVDGVNWALKTETGIAIGPFEQIAAWRL